jgi:hypothetical protein
MLLLTFTAIVTGLSGCGGGVSEEQSKAIVRIQELGGHVNYQRGGYEVVLSGTGVENADLALLKHIPNLKHLDLRSTGVTDEALPHLQALGSLQDLQLARTGVTVDGIATLRKALPQTEVER